MTLGALVAVLAAAPAGARSAGEIAVEEMRGFWVLAPSISSPERITALVRDAAAGGVNTLVVQVRAHGEASYRSAIDPRASDLDGQPASFDPLAATIEAAHRAGLKVHAWVNVNLVANGTTLPRSRDHVVARHPEWLMIPRPMVEPLRAVDVRSPGYIGQLARWTRSSSHPVDGLYLSPLVPAAQDYLASIVGEIAWKYAIDGLHLDAVKYPSETFDYSPAALAAFRTSRLASVSAAERQRLDQRAATDGTAWTVAFGDAWTAFRRDRLTTLVTRLATVAKAARAGLVISASVDPNADDARAHLFQDWQAWAAGRVVDVVCSTASTPTLDEFTRAIAHARERAGATPVWAGISADRLPATGTADHVRAARRAGVAGMLFFSYDSLAAADGRAAANFAGLKRVLQETTSGSGTLR